MLFGLVGSHTVLETARDALFLARIPATRLPFVYVAIAVVTLVATELLRRFGGGLNRRAALTVFTALASAITAIFWVIVGPRYVASLYALYTWSGLVTTLVLIHFWTLLGEMFSITQAKRVFGVIGAGSVLGAIVGSAAAGALSQLIDARDLLFVAAAGLAATAAVPLWLEDVRAAPAGRRAGEQSLAQNARFIARSPYARRIVALTTLGAIAVTIGDYLFKSAAAASVPAAELAGFFATVYLILNVLSLVVQLALASAIIRWLNVSTAIAVLPLLLTGGGLAMLAAAGLPAALMIKGAEGSLKHSLHRTASELLFVPLSSLARASVKTFNEVIGQRGGQGLASIVILVLVGLGAPPRAVAGALVAVSVIWLLTAITTRRHYVGLFRGRVAAGQVTYLEHFPDLDVASLEDLVASLDSQNDAQVIAAMAALDAENKARLVPSLILYHPSPEVVIEALSLFSRTRRASAAKVIDRIIDHPDLDIRIAAVTARSVIELDERGLRMRLSTEDSPEVRAAITVNLIASSAISGSDAADSLRQLLAHGTVRTRRALADAIGLRRAAGFEETLTELAGAPETEVQLAAIRAMTEVGGASMTRALIGLLDREVLRPAVRESLATLGEPGMTAAAEALSDPATAVAIRRELPKALGMMAPEPAAAAILARLPEEPDGMVRYRMIRALERLVKREPMVSLDLRALERTLESTVGRAYRYLDRRLALERGAAADPARKTPGHLLLIDMLDDKRQHTIDRAFRLLSLARPADDFVGIYRALGSERAELRAGALELLENLLAGPLRTALVALVDDQPDRERLAAGAAYHRPLQLDYDQMIADMLESSSDVIRDVTAFHIGELELRAFIPRLADLVEDQAGSADVARALAVMGRPGDGGRGGEIGARGAD